MRSGDPDPIDDLKLVVESKRHGYVRTVEVVSEAARWLKAALKGADVVFRYASCAEEDHYGFASFTVRRTYQGQPVVLEVKVAEVRDEPYFFAEVSAQDHVRGTLFPFSGSLRSEDQREQLLHYIADFLLSTHE